MPDCRCLLNVTYPIDDRRREAFEVGSVHSGIVVDQKEVPVVSAFLAKTSKSKDLQLRGLELANGARQSGTRDTNLRRRDCGECADQLASS